MTFSLEIKGFNISGNVHVLDKSVTLEGNIPFLARPFQPKIEAAINEELENFFLKLTLYNKF